MISYLDTHVLVWLLENDLKQLSQAAMSAIDSAADLRISPMVLLELEYLFEIERTYLNSADVRLIIEHDLNIRVCDVPFLRITEAALNEKWTRDPFDRLIVAHAKANGYAPLITADAKIRAQYPAALW